jgi:hypothetical protein
MRSFMGMHFAAKTILGANPPLAKALTVGSWLPRQLALIAPESDEKPRHTAENIHT